MRLRDDGRKDVEGLFFPSRPPASGTQQVSPPLRRRGSAEAQFLRPVARPLASRASRFHPLPTASAFGPSSDTPRRRSPQLSHEHPYKKSGGHAGPRARRDRIMAWSEPSHEKHSEDRQKTQAQDSREGKTVFVCDLPETQPQAREEAGAVVLSEVSRRTRCGVRLKVLRPCGPTRQYARRGDPRHLVPSPPEFSP